MSNITIDLSEYLVLVRYARAGALVEFHLDNATQRDVDIILRHSTPIANAHDERVPKRK